MRAWRTAGKLEDADRLAVSLLYSAADLLDETRDVASEETAYVQAIVLGRVTEVARFVSDRVAGDADGPSLADLLTAALDGPDTGPAL